MFWIKKVPLNRLFPLSRHDAFPSSYCLPISHLQIVLFQQQFYIIAYFYITLNLRWILYIEQVKTKFVFYNQILF